MTPPSSGIFSSPPSLLAGRHILVTGVANRWSIAWAVVRSVVKNGGRVTLTYLGESQKSTIEKLLEELPEENRSSLLLPLDVKNDQDMAEVAERLRSEGITLDGLVHSIAFAKREELDGAFLETSRDGFLLAQEISAYSLVALCRAFAPLMGAGSSVVAMTYLGSERIVPHYNVMGAAKAALEASVRYLAADLGPAGIRVNAISAGPVRTLAAAGIAGFKAMYGSFDEIAPMRRHVTIEDVGRTALYLGSDLSSAVTGEVVYVDGGFNILGVPTIE